MKQAAIVLLLSIPSIAFSQEPNKPKVGSITGVPADISHTGTCAASRAGYFETTGKEKMTEAKLAKFVSSSLRDGYVLTIYPETKNGIFVNMECIVLAKAQK